MIQILNLLKKGGVATLLDIDNAIYMTSAIERLPYSQRRKFVVWGLFAEFVGRIVLIHFFFSLWSENETFLTFLGIKFTPDSISLFIAGTFLICKSSKELYEFLTSKEQGQESQQLVATSFPKLIVEVTIINLILSIDSIVVICAKVTDISTIMTIFFISAIIRLLAIDKVAQLIKKYPSINIVTLVFLIIIGVELFLEGFWFRFPEEIFNLVMLVAIVFAIIHQNRRSHPIP